MATQKPDGGKNFADRVRNRVTSTRRLYYICARMGWRITGDALVMLGESPIATLPYGRALRNGNQIWDDKGWQESWQMAAEWKTVSSCDAAGGSGVITSTLSADSTTGLGRARLITHAAALDFIVNHARRYAGRYEIQLTQHNTFKSWVMFQRLKRAIGRATGRAIEELSDSLYPQSKTRGSQKISTRNWKYADKKSWLELGWHGGKRAFRRKVGRPVLSEAEWMARYEARRARGKRKYRFKTRKPIKAPEPEKYRRPQASELRVLKPDKPFALKIPKAKTPAESVKDEMLKEGRKMIEDAVKDLTKDATEAVMEWLWEVTGVRKKT